MHTQFKKNIHVTRLMKADGRLREFNFRRLNGPNGDSIFTIDVSDDRGNRILFRMQKENNVWKIADQQLLPTWIMENEGRFNEQIEEELRNAE